jgi:hypothetical protein
MTLSLPSFTLTPVEEAAGVGFFAGLAGAFIFHQAPSKSQILAISLGGAAAGAVIAMALGATPAAASTTSSAASMNPLALMMAPGTFQETATVGQPVTLTLPQGGSWTSVLGTPTSYGPTITPDQLQNGTAISWIYAGPGSVTITWTDSTGTAQTTTLQFTNA